VLNKSDLPETTAAYASLQHYQVLGYPVLTMCARRESAALLPRLEGQSSVLVGQSGVGKSTIINQLVPAAAARVNEISAVRNAGRHTTTQARLYRLGVNGSIIDSPGMQVFGLHHLDCEAAALALPEFHAWLGHCRFRDCRHLAEPGCAVDSAFRAGRIAAGRLASYRRLAQEIVSQRAVSPPKSRHRKEKSFEP
jgi:ribosome biogenesis GTPase